MDEETIINKLIKYWEGKLGIELSKDKVMLIKKVTYQLIDDSIKLQVTSAKKEKERSQRFKGLGIE